MPCLCSVGGCPVGCGDSCGLDEGGALVAGLGGDVDGCSCAAFSACSDDGVGFGVYGCAAGLGVSGAVGGVEGGSGAVALEAVGLACGRSVVPCGHNAVISDDDSPHSSTSTFTASGYGFCDADVVGVPVWSFTHCSPFPPLRFPAFFRCDFPYCFLRERQQRTAPC